MFAIIGVAREEIALFRSLAAVDSEKTYAGMEFYTGTLDGTEVVLVCSGIGAIPVAIAAQIAIDRFDIEAVVVSGPAGPVVPYLQQGDVVIANRVIRMDNENENSREIDIDILPDRTIIEADPQLLNRISNAYNDVFGAKSDRPQLISGAIVSSDRAISDRKTIGRLQRDYGAVAIDRDGAMVAEVCHMNKKPFILIRTVVDSPDGDFYNQFDSQLQVVPEYITALVRNLIAAPQEAPVA